MEEEWSFLALSETDCARVEMTIRVRPKRQITRNRSERNINPPKEHFLIVGRVADSRRGIAQLGTAKTKKNPHPQRRPFKAQGKRVRQTKNQVESSRRLRCQPSTDSRTRAMVCCAASRALLLPSSRISRTPF